MIVNSIGVTPKSTIYTMSQKYRGSEPVAFTGKSAGIIKPLFYGRFSCRRRPTIYFIRL